MMTTIATINTDASFHPWHKVGAYAFWIVYQGHRMKQWGPLANCKSPHEAEIMALGNALYALSKSKFDDVKYVVINTDCQHAISAIRDSDKKYYKGADAAIKTCQNIIKELKKRYKPAPSKFRNKPFLSWRYVKAHSEGENARLWVNNWLDEHAKIALWESIKQKELKKAQQ